MSHVTNVHLDPTVDGKYLDGSYRCKNVTGMNCHSRRIERIKMLCGRFATGQIVQAQSDDPGTGSLYHNDEDDSFHFFLQTLNNFRYLFSLLRRGACDILLRHVMSSLETSPESINYFRITKLNINYLTSNQLLKKLSTLFHRTQYPKYAFPNKGI